MENNNDWTPDGPALFYYLLHKTEEEKLLPRIPWSKEDYESLAPTAPYEDYLKRLEENKDGEFDYIMRTIIVNLANPSEAHIESLKLVITNPLFYKWIGGDTISNLINSIINKK